MRVLTNAISRPSRARSSLDDRIIVDMLMRAHPLHLIPFLHFYELNVDVDDISAIFASCKEVDSLECGIKRQA